MDISELQKHVWDFSRKHGFDQSSMETRTVYLMSEVGEMAKEILQLKFHPEQNEEIKERLGMEIYDVVWNLLELANKLEIDLEKAFRQKMEINKERVWT